MVIGVLGKNCPHSEHLSPNIRLGGMLAGFRMRGGYSARSACAGSITVVRSAGMRPAANETSTIAQATDANTPASNGSTSNSID